MMPRPHPFYDGQAGSGTVRPAVSLVVLAALLAGCSDSDVPPTEKAWSFQDAYAYMRDKLGPTPEIQVAHAEFDVDAEGVPRATSQQWMFVYVGTDGHAWTTSINDSNATHTFRGPIGPSGTDSCAIDLNLDSDAYAAAVTGDAVWRAVATRPDVHVQGQGLCRAGQSYWQWTARVFHGNQIDVLGSLYLGPNGERIADEIDFGDATESNGIATAHQQFTASFAPNSFDPPPLVSPLVRRVAFVGWIDGPAGLPAPPTSGSVTLVSPSGHEEQRPFDTGAGGDGRFEIVLEDLVEADREGTWSLKASVQLGAAPMAFLSGDWCTGLPSKALVAESPACALLDPA